MSLFNSIAIYCMPALTIQLSLDVVGLSSPSDSFPIGPVAGAGAGLVLLITLIVIIAFIAIRREKRKYQYRLSQQLELDSFHPPVLPPIDFDPEEEPDEWEICSENLTLLDTVGEGFFGIVLKGQVCHSGPPITTNNVQPLGTLCHGKGRKRLFGHDKMETMTVVACKMLKGESVFRSRNEKKV